MLQKRSLRACSATKALQLLFVFSEKSTTVPFRIGNYSHLFMKKIYDCFISYKKKLFRPGYEKCMTSISDKKLSWAGHPQWWNRNTSNKTTIFWEFTNPLHQVDDFQNTIKCWSVCWLSQTVVLICWSRMSRAERYRYKWVIVKHDTTCTFFVTTFCQI